MAAAGEPVEDLSLSYEAPVDCPDRAGFLARVDARAPSLPRSPATRPKFEVSVAVGDHVEGRLTSIDAAGRRATQVLEGDTCDAVANALALILALAIDSDPSGRPIPAMSRERSDAALPERPSVPPESPVPWRLAAEARGLVLVGPAPGPLFGVGGVAEAELGSGPFRQNIRVGGGFSASARADVPGAGGATFALAVGTVEECPAHLTLAPAVISPCARLDAGALHAQGYVTQSRAVTDAWADLGALADIRWMFGKIAFAAADGGLVFPLTRVRYHFSAPDVFVHQAPAVGSTGEIGFGMHFW